MPTIFGANQDSVPIFRLLTHFFSFTQWIKLPAKEKETIDLPKRDKRKLLISLHLWNHTLQPWLIIIALLVSMHQFNLFYGNFDSHELQAIKFQTNKYSIHWISLILTFVHSVPLFSSLPLLSSSLVSFSTTSVLVLSIHHARLSLGDITSKLGALIGQSAS